MKNEYIGLWTLLTVALAAFIGFSCLEPVTLAGVELKSSGIADRLTRPIVEPKNGCETLAGHSDVQKVATDTASKNILLIGDSMLEGLNPRLAAYANIHFFDFAGFTVNADIHSFSHISASLLIAQVKPPCCQRARSCGEVGGTCVNVSYGRSCRR